MIDFDPDTMGALICGTVAVAIWLVCSAVIRFGEVREGAPKGGA